MRLLHKGIRVNQSERALYRLAECALLLYNLGQLPQRADIDLLHPLALL